MKLWKSVALVALALSGTSFGQVSPPAGLPNAEPTELTTARSQYEARVKTLHEKVPDAVSKRNSKYVSDLQLLSNQIATTGNLDALLPIKAEREAYQNGQATTGFDAKDPAVPASARQLRTTFEADLNKISQFAATEEHNYAAAYLRQLEDLVKKLTMAGNVDGALAVRTEKQEVQSLMSTETTTAQPPAAAPNATAGSPAALAPTSESAKLDATYKAAVDQAKRLPREHYLAALNAMQDHFTRAGKLDRAVAVRKEIEAQQATSNDSPIDPATDPDLTSAKAKFEQECTVATKGIHDRYLVSLEDLVRAMTRKGDIAEAQETQKRLEGERLNIGLSSSRFYGLRCQGPEGSKLDFSTSGTWTEDWHGNHTVGTWRPMPDKDVVCVNRPNASTWHFKMAPDGLKCTRQEDGANWHRQ